MTFRAQVSLTGFVLAGGKSSRMGVDKALLEFEGQILLERALGVAGQVCSRVAIVGTAAKLREYGDVVEDIHRGCGPLGGIHAALASSTADLNLVLAVDMPFVPAALLSFLVGLAGRSDAAVTVPRTARGLQPLCAVYRREFMDPADKALQEGKYKIDALFGQMHIRVVEEPELMAAGFSEHMFSNLNTPDDLRDARTSV